jgi:tetratricopeptide (TPR) repeat protein
VSARLHVAPFLLFIPALALPRDTRVDPCPALAAEQRWQDAEAACRETWQAHGDPGAGALLARALYGLGRYDESVTIARQLLDSDKAGMAHRVLGLVARRERDFAGAVRHLETALRIHGAANDHGEMARDALALGSVAWERRKLAEALRHYEEAGRLAALAHDDMMAWYVAISHADVLRASGDYLAAERAVSRAAQEATSVGERAWTELKRGQLHVDSDKDALAEKPLRSALALAPDDGRGRDTRRSAALNLAWLARRAGRMGEAKELLARVEVDGGDAYYVALGRGQIAFDLGDYPTAVAQLRIAASQPEPGAWPWFHELLLGDALARLGDVAGAEAAYRRSVAHATGMVIAAGRLAPHVVSTYRRPHERLIALLGRQRRWSDALSVVAALDLAGMLRSEATPASVLQGGQPRGDASVPADSARASMPAPAPSAILEAWRGDQLLILLQDEDSVVRLEIAGGSVSGSFVGGAGALGRAADRLAAHPDDAVAARLVGSSIIRSDTRPGPLHVLLLGALARAPLALLADEHGLLADRWPLVRVLSVVPARASSPAIGPVAVFGDPTGDLAASRDEAQAVARRLGVAAVVGAEATRAAFRRASGAEILHVAAHIRVDDDGPRLLLADGPVTPRDVASWPGAPRLVVLATCGSAAARDESGWGSFAAAFLAAGAETVVATRWSIDDGHARRILEAFYESGGAADPVGGLVRAQRKANASGLSRREWGAFVALGRPGPR